MRSAVLPLLVTSLVLAALPAPRAVQASTGIQRCAKPDGSIAYTDHACEALGGKALPISGEMMTRLLSTQPRQAVRDDAPQPDGRIRNATRRDLAAGCARTPRQLQEDLEGAFALRDANRIAESYHWVGMSAAQGRPVMDRLQAMSQRPLHDVRHFNAQLASLSMQGRPGSRGAGGAGGIVQLRLGEPVASIVDMTVEQYAGCYFVRF